MARSAVGALVAALAFATPAAADSGSIRSAKGDGGNASMSPTVPLDEPMAPGLAGTSWRFVEILGVAPPATVEATLEFSAGGAAAGSSGCNRFFGRYSSAGTDLSFSDLGSTKMMCTPEVMAVETAVQTALNRTSHVAGGLDLLAADGTVLARLDSVTLPPVPAPDEP